MVLDTIVDLERVTGDFLRDHADIAAFDARVSGQLPRSFTRPWIKVAQLDAKDAASTFGPKPEHLVSYLLQLDCYAGSDPNNAQAEASALARAARAALHTLPNQTLSGVTVANVIVVSHVHLPDMVFDPPRERYVLTVELHAHAA